MAQIITIAEDIPEASVRRAVRMALVVAGALHGAPALLLAPRPRIDTDGHQIEVDRSTRVGECVARALVGILADEHGGHAVAGLTDKADRW